MYLRNIFLGYKTGKNTWEIYNSKGKRKTLHGKFSEANAVIKAPMYVCA